MALAIFDLDNTLIAGDSDHAWGQFLVEQRIVDENEYKQANDKFYQDYLDGSLDILEYLEFALAPLAQHSIEQLLQWREQFLEQKIMPMMLPKAKTLIEQHRSAGDTLLIITATNRFVTERIAETLGFSHLIATEPEMIDKAYTGKVSGVPSFKDGKVTRLNDWLEQHPHDLSGSYFYSDSHNDIPLMKRVDKPIAVDPDDKLREHCAQNHWKVMSLRT